MLALYWFRFLNVSVCGQTAQNNERRNAACKKSLSTAYLGNDGCHDRCVVIFGVFGASPGFEGVVVRGIFIARFRVDGFVVGLLMVVLPSIILRCVAMTVLYRPPPLIGDFREGEAQKKKKTQIWSCGQKIPRFCTQGWASSRDLTIREANPLQL